MAELFGTPLFGPVTVGHLAAGLLAILVIGFVVTYLARRGKVARGAVEPRGARRCLQRHHALTEQGNDHAGKHVTAAAGRHTGVSDGADVGVMAVAHDRPVSLEEEDRACPVGKFPRLLDTVLRHRVTAQPEAAKRAS